ncbi:hypothetical protein DFJ73DRAFT_83718 [Zopfochytrium polystomum]|nr:hypothetical protein DFJ73DRAFT_83718 [Zopfochytrium polystomum]
MAVQQQHVARGFSVPDATALLEATASVGPVPHSAIFTEPLASPTLPSPSSLLSHSPTSQSPPAMLGPTAPEDLPSPTTDPSGPTQEDLGSNKEPRSPSRLILGDEVIDEFIDYDLVYARHTFVASLEGQVCVFKSDSLELLDDTNSYWWLVKCIKTDEIGYIPAENIETPHERLARLNSFRNVQLALPSKSDLHNVPLPLIPRRNIRFNEVPSVCEDYDKDYYDSDDAEEEETVDGEPPIDSTDDAISPTAQSKAVFVKSESPSLDRQSVSSDPPYTSPVGKSRRVSSMTLGQNLFQKFIRRSGSKVDRADRNRLSLVVSDSLDRTRGKQAGTVLPSSSVHSKVLPNSVQSPNGSLTSPAGSPASSPLPSKAASPESAALNVLRIYAGNVDLKATFKTVSLSKTMSAIDLLEQALRRFRVTGTVEEYYLSVIHMDSLERRFTDTENVSETLEMLRQKHLPGVGFNSSSKMAAGPTSPIHASDDNFIKVIINKKLNLYEKKYHLVRIFICDEQDPLVRTYKTLGISPDATVRDIIGIAVKKFKLNANEPGFTLTSLFGDKGKPPERLLFQANQEFEKQR